MTEKEGVKPLKMRRWLRLDRCKIVVRKHDFLQIFDNKVSTNLTRNDDHSRQIIIERVTSFVGLS